MPRLRLLLRTGCLLLLLRLLVLLLLPTLIRAIQPAQIRLPANRNNASENTPMLDRHEREVEGVHNGPELTALIPARGYCIPNSLLGLLPAATSKQTLHAEKVRVECRHEESLMKPNLGRETEYVRAVVEMIAQESKPLVARYRSNSTYCHRS